MKPELLIINCQLPDPQGMCVPPLLSYIAIAGGHIQQTGPMESCPVWPAADVIDGEGCLALPGLVNGHCHAPMTLFRGMADDLALNEWLHDHIFPAEANYVTEEMVYWCSKLAAAEMLLSGTTCVADGYFHENAVARAFAEAGLRAVVAQAVIDFPAPGVPDPRKNVLAAGAFISSIKEMKNPLLTPAVFAHAPYTCSPQTLQQAKELTRQQHVPLFIHLAETQNEKEHIRELAGATPTQHLDALGILDQDTVCIHSVWLSDHDLDILASRGSSIVVCPQSNMKLASGMARLPEILGRNIPVGLGTDGTASNNTLDLFREMDICAKLQKLHALDPVAVPAKTILSMATGLGARALGLAENIGSLYQGSTADIILINTRQPHLQPFYTADTLVYSGSGGDVHTVIIHGKPVVRHRRLLTMDLDEVLENVRRLTPTTS